MRVTVRPDRAELIFRYVPTFEQHPGAYGSVMEAMILISKGRCRLVSNVHVDLMVAAE